MKLIVPLLFVIASSSLANGQCNCIQVLKCPSLAALLSKPSRTQAEIDQLRNAACGFDGKIPKVCCPAQSQSCATPDGGQGNCVDIYQCPQLANLVKPPISPDVTQFLQKSRCNGPTQYSVCCGAGAPPVTKVEVGNCDSRVFVYPPDPRTQCCGRDSSGSDRIIGGEEARIDEYPWLVIIEYVKDNKIKLLCGGTLISSRYVLTAGHCVTGPVLDAGTPKNVRVGDYDTTNPGQDCVNVGGGLDCNDPVLIIPIERTIPHPQYDLLSKKNDIALIRLRDNAPFTDFIRPICLPTTDVTKTRSGALNFTVAGWGAVNETVSKSAIKLYVTLPHVTQQQCQSVYSAPRRKANLWDKQMCAGGQKDRDSCKGDSGGPLMYENVADRIYELVGVVSFGPKPCGVENIPGVYTRVFEYKSWINSAIKP